MVADAGPLIAFGRIQRLELLPQVLGEVLVPHAVAVECLADPEKPGARAICDAFQAQLLTETPGPPPCRRFPFSTRVSRLRFVLL